MQSAYRQLPSVDRLLQTPHLRALADGPAHDTLADLAREALDAARQAIGRGEPPPTFDALAAAVEARALRLWRPTLAEVINATGVIIHTNLGRALLSDAAIAAASAAAASYSDLELDLASGERGSRHVHLEELLVRLTAAEAGLAVNNNASAMLLALTALAHGREVIVSRGQAVEIGGGFRIPDVLRQSGATLVEVGTTNRTYLHDYEEAITPNTAALLRVHSSNFRVVGFVHEVSMADLATLGRERGVAVVDDLGSGALLDTAAYGLVHEPMPQESVAAGAGLVCFSGDKLLGGPQAGIVVGQRVLVERLKRHPLARAVRLDKMTIAALRATLLHYLRGEATAHVPVWQMMAATADALRRRARRWARSVSAGGWPAQVVAGRSAVGGGSLPGETLPTWLLALPASERLRPSAVAARLRAGSPAVVARIEHDALLFDPRTVLPRQDPALLARLGEALDGAA
ncbi:MAG: L-seryl-tRNA(Sec) selenium transferase [Chloroflexi bacterium]|nr:L-seryl-tRNA(Sec) selenium transferase [Chloroflexota bacterium]